MNLRKTIVFLTGLMLSIAAVAGEHHRQRVEIIVDDGSGEPLVFDSETAGFDPMELQLGESRSVIDEDGNTTFIVRTEDGFEIESNGRRIDIPGPQTILESHIDLHGDEIQVSRRVVIERDGAIHDDIHDEEHQIHVIHEEHADQGEEHEVRIVRQEVDDTN